MNVIVIDDFGMENLMEKLRSYPGFKNGEVRKFGADLRLPKDYLLKYGNEVDVAIIDQFIGTKLGTEFGAWVNEHFPHIACILLTGGGSTEQKRDDTKMLNICIKAMESGFCSFMMKANENSGPDILNESLNNFFMLPSVIAKQKIKLEMQRGALLAARIKTKYQEYDMYATEFCLDSIQLIAKLNILAHGCPETSALAYSRSFRKIEDCLSSKIQLSNGKTFNLHRFGHKDAKKRYRPQMEIIRSYFKNFVYDSLNNSDFDKILGGLVPEAKMNINGLYNFFKNEKNREIAFVLMNDYPEKWIDARSNFDPLKEISKEFGLAIPMIEPTILQKV